MTADVSDRRFYQSRERQRPDSYGAYWTYLKRFTRLSHGFSRKMESLRAAGAVFVRWYSWCKKRTTVCTTPAMVAGPAAEPWAIDRLVPNQTES